MIKVYSYLRIILISILVILSVLTTIYCFGLENSVTVEGLNSVQITGSIVAEAEIFISDGKAVK